MRNLLSFAVVALAPAGMIALAAVSGGAWTWAALLYMTVFAWALDRLIPKLIPGIGGEAGADPVADRAAADRLPVALAIAHFLLLGLTVRALALGGDGVAGWVGLFLGAGLFFGQVSNANGHELIHRRDRRLSGVGKWVYISLLFGHHASAHTRVHHRFAATPDDPNTARIGESFYAFAPRAWRGSFARGYAAERAEIIRRGSGGATSYVIYVFGAAGFMALAGIAYGWAGVLAYLALAGFAQTQLLLSDYVQHYGLTRGLRDDGTAEPIGPGHSWNAGGWFSGHLMLNAPRHSDHHAHPRYPYPALALPDRRTAPRLPASLPVMSALALYPAGWRRVMDRALDRALDARAGEAGA